MAQDLLCQFCRSFGTRFADGCHFGRRRPPSAILADTLLEWAESPPVPKSLHKPIIFVRGEDREVSVTLAHNPFSGISIPNASHHKPESVSKIANFIVHLFLSLFLYSDSTLGIGNCKKKNHTKATSHPVKSPR